MSVCANCKAIACRAASMPASKAAKSFGVVAVGAGNASEIGRGVLSLARLRAWANLRTPSAS